MKTNATELLLVQELFGSFCETNDLTCSNRFTVDKLTGDASIRRYYRVYCDNKSFVVCLDHPLAKGQELPFVQKQQFLIKHQVSVPKIFDYNSQKGYILEEDLSDETLLMQLSRISNKEDELSIYSKIISKIAKLHRIPSKEVAGSKLFSERFDHEKLMDEIDFSLKFFIGSLLNFKDEKIIKEMRDDFDRMITKIAQKNMVLTHRDFHSRNIMIKENELYIIDFQDARMGLPQYDLVSLLEDCYYDLNQDNRDILIKKYFDEISEINSDQKDYDEFLEYYHLMAIQRVFKAIGSFSYINTVRNDIRYLKYIGFAMEKLRKILLEVNDYKNLRTNLFSIYYGS